MNTSWSMEAALATPARRRWTLALLAAVATLLIVWLFSPRYALWPAVRVPALNFYPETHRAYFTLLQLADPFLDIDHFSNKVIEWRLLFPLIFHYLKLPPTLFLAMPWIGCFLVLWYAAALLWERTQRLPTTAAGIVLLGTTSWFFTSTGWLTYFDSWYVLGGLIMAFSTRTWPIVLAAALTPWIDERIMFMVPACLAARAVLHWHDTGRALPDRRQWQLASAMVLPLAAYAVIRIAAMLWFDQGSREYAAAFGTRTYPLGPLAWGTWMGLRLAWLPVVLLPMIVAVKSRQLAWGIVAVTAFTVAVGLVLAGDISRSMSMLAPLALAGMLLLSHFRPDAERIVLALAVGNLLLPASHVVSSFTIPIFSARYELSRMESPPAELDIRYHLSEAVRLSRGGDIAGATRSLTFARQLTRYPDELATALTQFGMTEEREGRPLPALLFYRNALETAAGDWPGRAAVQTRVETVQKALDESR